MVVEEVHHPVADNPPSGGGLLPNVQITQCKIGGPPRRRRQQGGFLTDSINYGFDEPPKKSRKQKGGSVQPLNKIPWVIRVHIS